MAARGDGRGFERAGEDLRNVLDLERLLRADGLDAVFEHRDAEGAGRRHGVRAGGEGLLDTRVVDTLADLLLHPDTATSAAAAERAVAVAPHLRHAVAVDDIEHAPWLIVDAVPAADEAGVMIRQLAPVEAGGKLKLPAVEQ